MHSENRNQATLRLVWNRDARNNRIEAHGLARLVKTRRRKKIVKPLNSIDTGVANVSGLKFLKPLETESRLTGKIGPGEIAIAQKADSSLEKGLSHDPSLGKTLPKSQIADDPILETHYPKPSVIFSRMRAETTDDVVRALSENALGLKKTYNLSAASIANAHKEISAKTVNNVWHARHSVTLGTIAGVAHAHGLETWQLLISNLPLKYEEQVALAQIVRAYTMLSLQAKKGILHAAENEARGERKYAEIFNAPLPTAANAR